MINALMLFAAATQAAAPAPSGPQTAQQRFDTAIHQSQSGDCVHAIVGFKELETLPSFKDGSFAGAMLQVQLGQCMVRIGAFDAGETAIQKGLPTMRKAGKDFDVDVATSLVALGDAAMARWDYDRAKALYGEALAIPDGAEPIILHAKMAKASAFDGGPEPLQYAEQAIKLAEQAKDVTKIQLAGLHTIRARILLNQGRNKEAYDELKKALTLTGGLDLKVNFEELAVRSDLALAALLNGDEAGAHEYLAYTGAGRNEKATFTAGIEMEPPVCGSETGLKPDDFAIVEFAIGQDGRVIGASTIYTRGSAKVAAQFARAASGWAWAPEQIKDIAPFFLLATHAEVRCTTVAQQVPELLTPMRQRFGEWAAKTLGLSNVSITRDTDHKWAEQLKALSASNPTGPKAVAANGLMAISTPVSMIARDKLLVQALAAADAATPPEAVNWLQIEIASPRVQFRAIPGFSTLTPAAFLALLDKPEIARDALAADSIKLTADSIKLDASKKGRSSDRIPQSLDLTKQVAADDRLPAFHPLRQLANLSLANQAAQKGDFAAANTYFAATGLTEEQCALIGAKPAVKRIALNSNSFPAEAMKYGFEGWVRLEFDILGDGHTASVRPIVAYPPFVFASAATKGLAQSTFEASYRPEGGAACSAQRQGIAFMLPR